MELGLYPLHFLIMTTFDEKLKALLKTEQSFLDKDWELLEWKLQDSARNADEKLIKLLITDEEMKNKFFSEIAWYQVFNGNLFIEYISNKNFLDNSYTKYKNKIWLQTNGKFLKESGEVSLVRPFKDCVLEWWQTKEDEKKKEIFFNEILAQDEIDKLFAPKVLTNFKKYDKDWEHKVENFNRDENWTIKDNLIIKWNNLLALHTLKKNFEWMVKCIYIDVPYNTWSDSFWYNDKFNHSTWLTFMKNRLDIAIDLLKDDGIIFVSIDDHEQAYLSILMDEIFRKENYVQTIHLKKATPQWFKTVNPWPINVTEYISMYAKNAASINREPYYVKGTFHSDFSNYVENINDDCSKRRIKSLKDLAYKKLNVTSRKECKEKYWENYEQITLSMMEKCAMEMPEKVFSALKPNNPWTKLLELIEKSKTTDSVLEQKREWKDSIFILNWRVLYFYNLKLNLVDGELVPSEKLTDWRWDIPFHWIWPEWWIKLNNWKKPEKLLKRIIEIATHEWDIVLDFCLWSWTTAAVAHKLWRQYIWIEQLDYWENDSVVRLNNVINWDQSWISKSVNREWWWEFIYCELKKYNQEFIEQIETTKNTDGLLEIRESMKEKAYFKYNFYMQKFEENIEEFKNQDLEKQKELLIEILNKNQLYVNLSDIDDENFQVSDDDKNLNNLFYRL